MGPLLAVRDRVLAVVLALARVLVEPGSAIPAVSDDAVLLVKHDCPAGPVADAGLPDAGVPCTPTVSLVVQPRFTIGTDGSRFALLLVTPFEPTINDAAEGTFDELAALTAPVIQYRTQEVEDADLGTRCSSYEPPSGGCGGGGYPPYGVDAIPWHPPTVVDAALPDGPTQMVGPYDVATTRPVDATALEAWLTQLGYAYTQADLDAVTPYLARNYTVVAVRVSVAGPVEGALVPLALTWPGLELRLPTALGTHPGVEHLTAYVAASTRYEFPSADIGFAGPTTSGFLTRNTLPVPSDGTLDTEPVALVTGGPDIQTVIEEVQVVRVPMTIDCHPHGRDDDGPIGCCPACQTQRTRVRADWLLLGTVFLWVLRRRRR